MIRLILKAGRDASVRRRHPWLFSGAVARREGDGGDGWAEVFSAGGERLAAGAYSPESQILARLWVFGEAPPDPGLAGLRFDSARSLRAAVVPPETTGFRAVNSEGDRCPGVTLDVYGATGVLELSAGGVEAWESPLEREARRAFDLERVIVRRTGAVRDGIRQTEPGPAPDDLPDRVPFRENGLRFLADLSSGQKTGFFLDQRENRSRLRALAGGRRVLNLFSYSGGFSVAALAGGASRAVDVDASEGALALAVEHRRANGFDSGSGDFVRADVFEDLRRRVAAGETWDAVVCDPPAFAKKRADVDRAARGYKDINRLAMRLVAPGGILLTCSCSGAIDATLFQQIVFAAEIESGSEFSLIARQGAGPDHPVSIDCPEGEYLKGMWMIRTEGGRR
ncbi:MAG: class I SAM-dependent rRNA methyltransferase [Acidobacteriota bacterium]|nr:class I SAM-dependent rRNA methyltransferase [Acidobacteriota bacterium]